MEYLVTKVEERKGKNPPHNPYWVMTLIGEDGVEIDNVSTFTKPGEGLKIKGEVVVKDGKFKNFQTAQATARTNFGNRQRSQEILQTSQEIQEDISKRVHAAQDRSAWMWAKTNAADILAKSGHIKPTDTAEAISAKVIRLATLIYNGEPTEPFTSPQPHSHRTSPTEGHPDGIDMYDHPLTTDAERQAMDEEDINLEDIPF